MGLRNQRILLAPLVWLLAAGAAAAGDVTIKNVHLCCGACETAVKKALNGLTSVANPVVDRDSKTVTFSAGDAKAVRTGIAALAKAGFHGAATHGRQRVGFPPSGAKQGEKADSVTLAGVHLCCTGCVNAAQKSLIDVAGVLTIDIDRSEKTITLKGKAVSLTAAVRALNRGGFHGVVKRPGKK